MANSRKQSRNKAKSTVKRKSVRQSFFQENARLLGIMVFLVLSLLIMVILVDRNQLQQGYPSILFHRATPTPIVEAALHRTVPEKKPTPVPTAAAERRKPTPLIRNPSPLPSRIMGAIIIDDFGLKREIANEFLALPAPIAFSVLPTLPYSRQVATAAHRQGKTVLAHIPMEALQPDALRQTLPWILKGMNKSQIVAILDSILAENPYAAGANNHTGSKLTTSEPEMTVILDYLKRRNMFFIDSRTTAETIAYRMARKMGIPAAERNVFFDDDESPEAIAGQCERFIELGKRNGHVIGIGHPKETTIQVLRQYIPKFRDAGITLVPVQEILQPPQDSEFSTGKTRESGNSAAADRQRTTALRG